MIDFSKPFNIFDAIFPPPKPRASTIARILKQSRKIGRSDADPIASYWKNVGKWTQQAELFVHLQSQIDLEYFDQADQVRKRDGLEAAIAFCHSKLQPSVMQAQRDFERHDSAE